MTKPFNPLDKRNLGTSVATAMLDKPVVTLPPEPFEGAGIYAIYYTGSYSAYERIATKNKLGHHFLLRSTRGGARTLMPFGARF